MKHAPILQTKKQEKKKGLPGSRGLYILLAMLLVAVAITGYVARQRGEVNSRLAATDFKYAGESKIRFADPPLSSIPPDRSETIVNNANNTAVLDDLPPVPKGIVDDDKDVIFSAPINADAVMPFSGDNLVYSKTMEDWRTHSGMDFPGAIGTPVKAAANGIVEDIFQDEMIGNVVVVRHSTNLETIYANLQQEILVTKGQQIEAGTVLGGIGNTAASEIAEPPHLHFELWKDGIPIDPLIYIAIQ